MIILNLTQGSPDWLIWRQGGIGASDVPMIRGKAPKKWGNRDSLLLEKVGLRHRPDNKWMKRGRDLEATARSLYTEITGIPCRPVCIIHSLYPYMKASLDGLSYDNKIIQEIKCPSPSDHRIALDNKVPEKYVDQLQWQLFVSGLEELHYFSFCPLEEFVPLDYPAIVKVKPASQEYVQQMVEDVKRFQEDKERLLDKKAKGELPLPAWLRDGEGEGKVASTSGHPMDDGLAL